MISFVSASASWDGGDSAGGIPGSGDLLPANFYVRKPICSVGDLIVIMVGTSEAANGWGAFIKKEASITDFTDLLTDGYIASGLAYQYRAKDTGPSDLGEIFWYIGWKIADSSDTTPGNYQVNCLAQFFDPFLGHNINPGISVLKASCIVHNGASDIDAYAAEIIADTSGTPGGIIICPGITPPGEPATGDFEMQVTPPAGASQSAAITMSLNPADGDKHLILCGTMGWLSQPIHSLSPLADVAYFNWEAHPYSICWGEIQQKMTVWLWQPHYVGHDTH